MIHHVFTRTKDGQTSTCVDRQLTPQEALKYFVEAELRYNSNLTVITDTKIVTNSRVMGCTDDMTFTGTKEDMAELVEIAHAFEEASKGSPTVLQLFTETKNAQFNAEASEFLTALASGEKPFAASIWHMLSRKKAIPSTEIKLRDARAAFELIYCDGQDPAQVLELAGIAQAA